MERTVENRSFTVKFPPLFPTGADRLADRLCKTGLCCSLGFAPEQHEDANDSDQGNGDDEDVFNHLRAPQTREFERDGDEHISLPHAIAVRNRAVMDSLTEETAVGNGLKEPRTTGEGGAPQ